MNAHMTADAEVTHVCIAPVFFEKVPGAPASEKFFAAQAER
jgi:hypothetical protein